jgi:hypothetical protein
LQIALIGNCQVQSLGFLADLMLDGAEIRTFDYSEPYSRSEENRRVFADGLANCDLIVAQTALMTFTNERDLRERYGNKLITIANFYFRGLFPDSCYIGDFEHRVAEPLAVHSVLVLDAFRRGLSERAALRQFDIAALEKLDLLNAWSESMDEMRRREANGVVNVPGADFMEDACRRYPAFLTMNHPTVALLADYLHEVFAFAGIGHKRVNAMNVPDPLGEHDTTPILDCVADHLRLPYRVPQRWKINVMNRRSVGPAEFVALCYKAYRRFDKSHLVIHSPTDMIARFSVNAELAYLVNHTVAPPTDAMNALVHKAQRLSRAEGNAPPARRGWCQWQFTVWIAGMIWRIKTAYGSWRRPDISATDR